MRVGPPLAGHLRISARRRARSGWQRESEPVEGQIHRRNLARLTRIDLIVENFLGSGGGAANDQIGADANCRWRVVGEIAIKPVENQLGRASPHVFGVLTHGRQRRIQRGREVQVGETYHGNVFRRRRTAPEPTLPAPPAKAHAPGTPDATRSKPKARLASLTQEKQATQREHHKGRWLGDDLHGS
jgi:hypothetical protein